MIATARVSVRRLLLQLFAPNAQRRVGKDLQTGKVDRVTGSGRAVLALALRATTCVDRRRDAGFARLFIVFGSMHDPPDPRRNTSARALPMPYTRTLPLGCR